MNDEQTSPEAPYTRNSTQISQKPPNLDKLTIQINIKKQTKNATLNAHNQSKNKNHPPHINNEVSLFSRSPPNADSDSSPVGQAPEARSSPQAHSHGQWARIQSYTSSHLGSAVGTRIRPQRGSIHDVGMRGE